MCKMLAFLSIFYEISFGGYATFAENIVFCELALNSYDKL
jgi:hypothetical protein